MATRRTSPASLGAAAERSLSTRFAGPEVPPLLDGTLTSEYHVVDPTGVTAHHVVVPTGVTATGEPPTATSPLGLACSALPTSAELMAWRTGLGLTSFAVSTYDVNYSLSGSSEASEELTEALMELTEGFLPSWVWSDPSVTPRPWAGEPDAIQVSLAASILSSTKSAEVLEALLAGPLGVFTRRYKEAVSGSTGGSGLVVDLDLPLLDPLTTACRRALRRYLSIEDGQQASATEAAQDEDVTNADTKLALDWIQKRLVQFVEDGEQTTAVSSRPHLYLGPAYAGLQPAEAYPTRERSTLPQRPYNPTIGRLVDDSPFIAGLWGASGQFNQARALLLLDQGAPEVAALPLNWSTCNQAEYLGPLAQWLSDLDTWITANARGGGTDLPDVLEYLGIGSAWEWRQLIDTSKELDGQIFAVSGDAEARVSEVLSGLNELVETIAGGGDVSGLKDVRTWMNVGFLVSLLLLGPAGALVVGLVNAYGKDALDEYADMLLALEKFEAEAKAAVAVGTPLNDVMSHLMFAFREAFGGLGVGTLGPIQSGPLEADLSLGQDLEETLLLGLEGESYRRLNIGVAGPWYLEWLEEARSLLNVDFADLVAEFQERLDSLDAAGLTDTWSELFGDHYGSLAELLEAMAAAAATGATLPMQDDWEQWLREVLDHPATDPLLLEAVNTQLDWLIEEAESATPVYMLDDAFFDWTLNGSLEAYDSASFQTSVVLDDDGWLSSSSSDAAVDLSRWIEMASPLYQLVRAIDLASAMLEAGLQAESIFLALSGLATHEDSGGAMFREIYDAYGMSRLDEVLPKQSLARFTAACWRQALTDQLLLDLEAAGYDMNCVHEVVAWMRASSLRSDIDTLLGPLDAELGRRRYEEGLLGVMGGGLLDGDLVSTWDYANSLDDAFALLDHDQQVTFREGVSALADRTRLRSLEEVIAATATVVDAGSDTPTTAREVPLSGASPLGDLGDLVERFDLAGAVVHRVEALSEVVVGSGWEAMGPDLTEIAVGPTFPAEHVRELGSTTGWVKVLADDDLRLGVMAAAIQSRLGRTSATRLGSLLSWR